MSHCLLLVSSVEDRARIILFGILGVLNGHDTGQGVEGIQSSLFTGAGSAQDNVQIAIEDTQLQSQGVNSRLPGAANELVVNAVASLVTLISQPVPVRPSTLAS